MIPAQERFVARDHFITSLDPAAKVPIVYVMGNFNRWFLDKIEEPSREVSLMWYELQRNSGDQTIIAALGGKAKRNRTNAL